MPNLTGSMVRHLRSILLLPFMAAVVIPYGLRKLFATVDTRWSEGSVWAWPGRLLGAACLGSGLALFGWCVKLFAQVGQGTLAPWDPTRNLVAVGPYRYVRNPMISGVALILLGQALLRGSRVLGLWAGGFILINQLYFTLSEEPGLERRFGERYRRYRADVPRWIPRLRSW